MTFDLAFGLGEKSQVPFVAQDAGDRAERERRRVKQRIEITRAPAQFVMRCDVHAR